MRHKKAVLILILSLICVSVVLSGSSGPPDAYAGAPGESNCTSCHGSFPVNSGGGTLTIDAPAMFWSGTTLDITVTLKQTGQSEYGFEVTVLDGANQPVGELVVTDAVRTQKSTAGTGREYLKHTIDGITPNLANGSEWSFQWVASGNVTGPVTFYAAGNAANGNSSTSGDFIYTASAAVANIQEGSCPVGGEAEFIALINETRADSGRATLEVDARLMSSARRHAQDMLDNGIFSYTGSDGSNPWERVNEAGYSPWTGSLIGYGGSAEHLFQVMMDDDPHREVILSTTHRHVGAGNSGGYFSIDFGGSPDPAVPTDCISSCCVGRVGDANGAGGDEPTIGDVTVMIDALFIGNDWNVIPCVAEADINQSGGSDPQGGPTGDVTIGDVSYLIDYLFITGPDYMTLPDCL
jgi:uncharacterized protein YkwD